LAVVHLHIHSHFSFGIGVSSPEVLVAAAAERGHRTLACTDSNGVYGAVEFQRACEAAGVRPILGAHLVTDHEETVALAIDERGWAALCRAVSAIHWAGVEWGIVSLTPGAARGKAAMPGNGPLRCAQGDKRRSRLPPAHRRAFFPPVEHGTEPPPEDVMAEPLVGVVMGSDSDWETMQHAARRLEELGVPFETRVVSAHRTPDLLFRYAEEAAGRGLRCIIAGAGGAAHLPGMLAAKTALPIFGVPVPTKHLQGLDSLLSIVQMPAGIPVATFAIGAAGAQNAALCVAAVLALADPELAQRLEKLRREQTRRVLDLQLPGERA
jgi:5-(carboxyamino)imidazole ribonucleotide mutase